MKRATQVWFSANFKMPELGGKAPHQLPHGTPSLTAKPSFHFFCLL